MKKILYAVLVALVLLTTIFSQPTLAADTDLGAKLFKANCAACHAGGKNVVSAAKNLKKDALKQYGMNSPEAIIAQVTNGKGGMPSFKKKLKPEEVEAVAAYVLAQADKGWSK